MDGWTPLAITMELGPDDWADIGVRPGDPFNAGSIERIGVIPDGTNAGKPAVGLAIRQADGSYITAWTTWNLLASAVGALRVRYGDPQ